jgi:hypothetical protein
MFLERAERRIVYRRPGVRRAHALVAARSHLVVVGEIKRLELRPLVAA